MIQQPTKPGTANDDLLKRIERLEARFGIGKDTDSAVDSPGPKLFQCSLPMLPKREFAPDVSPARERLILLNGKKWVNGTKLRYCFFDDEGLAGNDAQKRLVREGFSVWKNVGIGISFEETRNIREAEIRISFRQDGSAWSYLGRDVIDIPGQGEPTMNFGWDLTRDPRGVDVPVHEIGHTLDFPHEHQNPFSGIVWDEPAVIDYFSGPPNNWSKETINWNILRKLTPSEVSGSRWDPDSIMHYGFPAGLIIQPPHYQAGLTPKPGLSANDIEQVRLFYPPLDENSYKRLTPNVSQTLVLEPTQQANFVICPDVTRDYTIQTFGESDTVMVLFDDQNGDHRFVAGDDDSGISTNARIDVRLYQGKKYILRIRMFFDGTGGRTSVMLW